MSLGLSLRQVASWLLLLLWLEGDRELKLVIQNEPCLEEISLVFLSEVLFVGHELAQRGQVIQDWVWLDGLSFWYVSELLVDEFDPQVQVDCLWDALLGLERVGVRKTVETPVCDVKHHDLVILLDLSQVAFCVEALVVRQLGAVISVKFNKLYFLLENSQDSLWAFQKHLNEQIVNFLGASPRQNIVFRG